MKLSVETDGNLPETEVLIRCAAVDEHIASMVASLRMHDRRIVGKRDGETTVVAAGDVLYFETVDGHAFAYTAHAVLEVPFTISELAERLADATFERCAKGCLINLCRVASLRPYVGGRLLARLDNGEEIVISRRYAKDVKKRLGA